MPKLCVIIAVLESYEVVRRQLMFFSKFMNDLEFTDVDVVIADDGSNPSISKYLSDFDEFFATSFSKDYYIENSPIRHLSTIDRKGAGLNLIEFDEPFPFTVLETLDTRKWTQPLARNRAAALGLGDNILFTDIDHILTKEVIQDSINFTGDKMDFNRRWGVLDERGNVLTDKDTLIEYGCKPEDIEKTGSHCNSFVIKRSIFEKLEGYDPKYVSKYGGDDVDFLKRYGELHYSGGAARTVMSNKLMYVYPDPRKDVKKVFHSLRR
jgi:hypothetical protein